MLRIVLYAEGPGETGSSLGFPPPAPGRRLPRELEGPAHVLVRRCACELLGRAEHEVRFDVPLRYQAREVRGGDLRNPRILRRVLQWPKTELQPELAIVLVDQDGDSERRRTLLRIIEEAQPIPIAILGVPVQEFEAWLLSDHSAVMRVLELTRPRWQHPEGMEPGNAKEVLARLVSESTRGATPPELRLELARAMDLPTVCKSSRSFDRFVASLKQATSASS